MFHKTAHLERPSSHLQIGEDVDEGRRATEGHDHAVRVPRQQHLRVLPPLPQQLEAVQVVQLQAQATQVETQTGKLPNEES